MTLREMLALVNDMKTHVRQLDCAEQECLNEALNDLRWSLADQAQEQQCDWWAGPVTLRAVHNTHC